VYAIEDADGGFSVSTLRRGPGERLLRALLPLDDASHVQKAAVFARGTGTAL
jgi:hypothetical protein